MGHLAAGSFSFPLHPILARPRPLSRLRRLVFVVVVLIPMFPLLRSSSTSGRAWRSTQGSDVEIQIERWGTSRERVRDPPEWQPLRPSRRHATCDQEKKPRHLRRFAPGARRRQTEPRQRHVEIELLRWADIAHRNSEAFRSAFCQPLSPQTALLEPSWGYSGAILCLCRGTPIGFPGPMEEFILKPLQSEHFERRLGAPSWIPGGPQEGPQRSPGGP